jgi:hypothetical protein
MLGGLGVWQANSHYDFNNRLVFHDSHVKLCLFYELKQNVITTSVKNCSVNKKERFLMFTWHHENNVPLTNMKRSIDYTKVSKRRVISAF